MGLGVAAGWALYPHSTSGLEGGYLYPKSNVRDVCMSFRLMCDPTNSTGYGFRPGSGYDCLEERSEGGKRLG